MRRLCLAAALCACSSAPSFQGLAPAHDQGGPRVRFDLAGAPIPDIPFPSDIATRPDTGSPTGVRLNLSLVAPTAFQGNLVARLDQLDGFGTFAPITVGFDKPLDVLDLFARQNDADPADDAVFLVDLGSGLTTPLDFGSGRLPYTSIDPAQYFPADPLTGAWNVLFPVSGPAANFLHPELPHDTARQQADDLLSFYERATGTLILRPALPLREASKYAVVLTTRLKGVDGLPISSPHSGINHATQTGELEKLPSLLPAGTSLQDVAYCWAFTTGSISRELDLVRRGLGGDGPLQILAFDYPVGNATSSSISTSSVKVLQETGAYLPGIQTGNPGDYIITPAVLAAFLTDPAVNALPVGSDPGETAALLATWQYVDYFVSGSILSPSFLEGPGGVFNIDESTGIAHTAPQTVTFFLAVPKEQKGVGHLAPFPLVLAGHDYDSDRFDPVLAFGGTFAKFGLATLAIDAYGYGFALDPAHEAAFRAAAAAHGVSAFADAMLSGRARDLDGDGVADSGGDVWTGDAFHTRDVIRQTAVDWMQVVRMLQFFDGANQMQLGTLAAVAGDFNHDGIPDVGGIATFNGTIFASDRSIAFRKGDRNPGADMFAFGIGLGGIVAGILPAVQPGLLATVPASPAGGLSDMSLRTTLPSLVRPLYLDELGPIVAACPFSFSQGPADPQGGAPLGACAPGAPDAAPTLVLVVREANRERDLPVAPLALAQGQQVMVRDLARAPGADCRAAPVEGCATGSADAQGGVRVSMPADGPPASAGDPLDVTVFDAAGVLQQRINTFSVRTRLSGTVYEAGSQLVSPASGSGLPRNTPGFRQLAGIDQLILDRADPINYAGRITAGMLVIGTAGDPTVPVGETISLARVAGLVPLQASDPDYGIPLDQVLVKSAAVEGVVATRRFDDPDGGVWTALPGHVRCDPGADCTGEVVIDPSGYSCDGGTCSDGQQAPRLDPPLQQQLVRLTAAAGPCPVNGRAGATGCWSTGASACDPAASGRSALLLPLLDRAGTHGFSGPKPGRPFDVDQFIANAVGRYLECRGHELRFDACQADLSSCSWIPPPPP
ncbi:MAG TPA: hypothetical protein VMK66_00030 [Myxococcales bacterium]|nr:hypothetical protein [Myxococcales bacterium]